MMKEKPKEQNGSSPHPAKIETKVLRHDFTPEERNNLGGDLARQIASKRGIEAEFDQVRSGYKAKLTESETRIDSLSTSLVNGFDLRPKKCRVVFVPKEAKKHYFLEDATEGEEPVLIEEMTGDDFQADLIQAESAFEHRFEIELWPMAGSDRGIMAVGRLKGMWYAALRVQVGQRKIEERLDSEQANSKKRIDMIRRAAKRLQEWLVTTLGKDAAKGFEEPIFKAVEAQKEREE